MPKTQFVCVDIYVCVNRPVEPSQAYASFVREPNPSWVLACVSLFDIWAWNFFHALFI
jgi:hypothetical protein